MMAPGSLMTLSLHACIGPRTAPGLVFALQLNRENIFTKSNYKITATYGLKLVMTGERSAYDEALDAAWDHFPEADALSFLGTQTVEGEACYWFEVSLSEGSKQVAVSKTDGTLFELPAA